MTDTFTADAARALGGPEWLIERRLAAAERLRSLSWPTPREEGWRYNRIGELEFSPVPALPEGKVGPPGAELGAGGRASFPHTVVSLGEHAEATVLDRFGSPESDHLVDAVTELLVGDHAHLRYLSVQEHGSRTWHLGLQRALVGRDATLKTSAVVLGGDYARLRSESVLRGERGESDQLAGDFAD